MVTIRSWSALKGLGKTKVCTYLLGLKNADVPPPLGMFQHAEIGTAESVLEAQAGHLSKRMSDHYKHISEKAARKAPDELVRVKAAQRAEARAKLAKRAGRGITVVPVSPAA